MESSAGKIYFVTCLNILSVLPVNFVKPCVEYSVWSTFQRNVTLTPSHQQLPVYLIPQCNEACPGATSNWFEKNSSLIIDKFSLEW